MEIIEPKAVVDEWRGTLRVIGWGLVGCWIALSAAVLLLGESQSSFVQLRQDVASGSVTEVRVTEGLRPSSKGYALVEVHWRKGMFGYTTQVVEAEPRTRGSQQSRQPGVTARIRPSTAERLQDANPTVSVTEVGHSRLDGELFDRLIPGWLVLPTLLLWLSTITYLVTSPRPWRATKWAWFWLLGILPPLGALAFLAFGGPTRLLAPPAPGSRRLTGGWAFLISLVLGSVFFATSR